MKCAMWNLKCVRGKAGVSLITVLLFMLVATIAATATYKWITSEGRSSASRMMEREAYQSSVAGIESARSWMTYHANETGALIKQYKDGKNAPIKLNDQLAEFVRAGQSFDVWLVGVNTENSTYKLKIMSTGKARNGGATHSEIAIFNVTGLYQVKIPKEHVSIDTDFKYAYFGGSLSYEGQSDATAMVVNGNWGGRPPKTANGDFVVTGNATLGGNLIDVSEYACIGGNLTTNNGFKSHYLYVHGNTTNFTGVISGDAYFDGDMSMSSACGGLNFHVQGNMTVGSNAKVKFGECQNNRTVDGNTCVIENGQIQANGDAVFLNGGAWMESDYPIWRMDGSEDATKVVIGKDANQKVYIKNGYSYESYTGLVSKSYDEEGKRNCPSSFKIRNENYNTTGGDYNFQGTPPQYAVPTTTAHVVNVCGSLTNQTADQRDYWYNETGFGFGGPYTIKKEGKAYFVDYNDDWKDWEVTSHTGIFPEKSSMDGKYYIYNAPEDFLTFSNNQVLNDWRVFKNIDGLHADPLTAGAHPIPTHINDTYNFDKYFHPNKARVGSYMFEGSPSRYRYYEPTTDANAYYRYENNKPTGSPYCNQGSGTEAKYRPSCHVLPWFTVNGTFQSWTATKPDDMVCAEGAKSHCYDIWEYTPGTGCDGSDFTVKDQLKTGYEVFKDYADRVTCSSMDHATLHSCWQAAVTHDEGVTNENDKLLYNGYMVLTLTAEHFKGENTAFEGKYIIIIESGNGEMLKLPPTKTENDFVMLYLPNGFMGQHVEGIGSGLHNYFIYMEKDIRKITGSFNLNGTIYGKIGSGADKPCAKVRSNNNVNLVYNESLMSDMMLNGLLCKASATNCGGPAGTAGSSGSASGVSVSTTYISDSYYVSLAPQLSITLESQYENNETIANVSTAKEVEGSFVVLPRVVFITKDAVGKLENYYRVVTLNSSTPATVSDVSCTPAGVIPVTGNLTQNGYLIEDLYTCVVKGSVAGTQQSVPFYVKVSGEGAAAPKVSFMEESAELAINGTSEIKLNWEKTTGVGLSCKVTVAVSDHDDSEWEVSPNGATGTGPYEFTINTSNDPNVPAENPKIFDVLNKNSSDGAVYFMIVDVEGCKPGNPATEVVYNANTVTIRREGLEEYCAASVDNGGGSGTPECESGGEYHDKINWPSCFSNGDEELWITANGQSCKPNSSEPNNEWTCGITSNVTLTKVQDITGCVTILPSGGISTTDAPFSDGDTRTLYADIKAVQQTFHAGFAVTGALNSGDKINISVAGPGTYAASKSCTYGNFTSSTDRAANCDIGVYRGSVVTLTLDPENSNENKGFNYWRCEPGSVDCSRDDTYPTSQFQLTITGENTVYAHFGEKDKHCFFDEFKDGSGNIRYNRADIECSDGETYCIDDCGGTCASISSAGYTTAKWKLLEGSMDNLVYSDGILSFSPSATRGMREADKAAVKAEVLSTAVAGKHGELKAQFQVPFEGVASGDIGKSTTKNSGFILRSTSDKSSYLLLNIYAEHSGALKTRLCLKEKGKEDRCSAVKSLNTSVSQTSIVMASARTYSEDGTEKLTVTVWPSSWSSLEYSATFALTNDVVYGIEKVLPNEYVGFSLANPNFKIHGIGWKSNTYGSECWETFPTISCSFKANFAGGIVPRFKTGDPNTEKLKPWTGLSAWYGTRSCTVNYHYLGEDACGGNTSSYQSCGPDGYTFTEGGAHGYVDPSTLKEVKTAKVTVDNNCDVYGEEASWATNGVAAHCGKFWVGDLQQCTSNYIFTMTTGNAEGEYYKLSSDGKANLRDAMVRVALDNPNKSEVEIYLFSQNTTTGYYDVNYVYSLPYKSNQQSGVIELAVDDISTVDGFDPENVVGIYVKTFGDNSVSINSVESACSHVISISGCSVAYNVPAQRWEISTVVNNYSHTKTIAISGDNPNIAAGSAPSCNRPSPDPTCVFDNVGTNLQGTPQATNVSFWSDNPYAITGDDTYNFTVTLTTDDDPSETLTCNTTGTKTGISASCGTLSRTTVTPGGGLPVLQNYSISNCPDNQCKYKIKLVKDDGDVATVVDETTTGDGYWDTPVTSVNGNGSALDEGTYKFVLTSENTARAFVGCESSTFTIAASTEGVVTGACSFANSSVTAGSTVLLNITDRGDGARWDERNDVQNISAVLSGGGTTTDVTVNRYYNAGISVSAPTAAGNYTYTITYDGNTFCTASLTVESVSDVLSATCPDIETFPLKTTTWGITMSGYTGLTSAISRTVSVNGSSWSKDCSSTACGDMDAVMAPAAVGEYTYTLTAAGTALCGSDTRKYVVKNPLECYIDDQLIEDGAEINLITGESFKFKAAWADGVGGGNPDGCEITGNNVTSNGCYNDQSVFNSDVTITPSETGNKGYTYSVKLDRFNGNKTDAFTCSWTMKVKEPALSVENCPDSDHPINAEPLTLIDFTPDVTGCGSGCNYTLEWVGHAGDPRAVTDNSYDGGQISFTGDDASGVNTYHLTVTNSAATDNSDECDIKVNYKKPTYTCPDDQEVGLGAQVVVTPTDVQYCANGCSYTITGGTFTDNSTSGTGYSTGALSKKIKGETTASTDDGTSYTLTLTNPAGDDAVNCSFKVKYVDDTPVCATVDPGTPVECSATNASGSVENWGTGAKCVKLHTSSVYVHSSNGSGRYFCVNGVEATMSDGNMTSTQYRADAEGYVTVCATKGTSASTQISWDRCTVPPAQVTFDCDASNSQDLSGANDGAGGVFTGAGNHSVSANTCYSFRCYFGTNGANTGSWNFSAPTAGTKMTYTDCSGTTRTYTFQHDNWWYEQLNLGACRIYLKTDAPITIGNCSWK